MAKNSKNNLKKYLISLKKNKKFKIIKLYFYSKVIALIYHKKIMINFNILLKISQHKC